jgi:membrane protein YqaA with SNARE-associated domain
MNKWLKQIYDWNMRHANAKWGPWIMLLCGVADSSFLPLPITTLFLALSLFNPRNTFKYALFLISGIVIGASAGYLAGHYAWLDKKMEFTGFARFFIDTIPGFSVSGYEKIHILFSNWGSWILIAATATPIPYGLFSISSGAFNVNIIIFIAATIAGHSAKYFLLGFLTSRMGPSVYRLLEYSLKPVALISKVAVLISVAFLDIFR